jgi:putative inorganic carbon (HCO3(-)) transporter
MANKNIQFNNELTSFFISLLFCLMPLIEIPLLKESIVLPKIFTLFFFVVGIILCNLKAIANNFKSQTTFSFSTHWMFAYLVLISITLFFSSYIYRSWIGTDTRFEGYFVLLLYGVLFLLSSFFYKPESWHFKLFLICASLMALHAIFIRYEGIWFGIDANNTDILFFQFTGCGNQNFLGSYMALAMPVGVYYVLKEGKWSYYIPAGLVYFGLLCSNTRGAWIGACLAFCAMVILYWKQENCKKRFLLIVLLFAGVTCIYFFTHASFAGRFESFSSVDARFFIYGIVLKLIAMRPLTGWGIECLDLAILDTFRQEVIDYFGYYAIIDKAHCEILQVAVSSGIPAAIAFVGTQVSVVVRGIRHFTHWAPWSPLLFSVAGYMVAALWNISSVNVAPVFWIFCGMIVAMTTDQKETISQDLLEKPVSL